VAVVVHTTGGGILARFRREGRAKGDRTPHDTAVRVYRHIMPQSGHYVVGQRGECVQVVPEGLCAWHVGGAGSAPYWREHWRTPATAWWVQRWPDLDSPRELAGGRLWDPYIIGPSIGARVKAPLSWGKGSANAWSVGIEVVPPESGAADEWSPECWATVRALVRDVCARNGIPCEREYVICHSDAHPLARSVKGQPWDLSPSQWTWERFEAGL
jgi:hypothetical protein